MDIKEVKSKKEWEGFLLECKEKSFLHSWNWGKFQEFLGNKIWRFGIFDNATLISVVLIVKHTAKRGLFLLIPHGPVISSKHISNQPSGVPAGPASELEMCLKKDVIKITVNRLKDLSKEENVDFVRISPIWGRNEENNKLFKDLGFRLRALHTHPESSWKLNIEPSEEEILNGMRKTTRYLIKQAEKDADLKIFQSFDIKDVEIFNKLHLEVVKHQKFIPFSLGYFQKEFESFSKDNHIALFFAKYKGKIIAASYGIFWSNMAFYHHAAAIIEYKKIPASYLLQWEAIKEAKKRGCKIYDFWGYSDPQKNPKHPYSGPTLFKMGFGGYKEEYIMTQDFVITWKYWLNYIVETIRKYKRGLH